MTSSSGVALRQEILRTYKESGRGVRYVVEIAGDPRSASPRHFLLGNNPGHTATLSPEPLLCSNYSVDSSYTEDAVALPGPSLSSAFPIAAPNVGQGGTARGKLRGRGFIFPDTFSFREFTRNQVRQAGTALPMPSRCHDVAAIVKDGRKSD